MTRRQWDHWIRSRRRSTTIGTRTSSTRGAVARSTRDAEGHGTVQPHLPRHGCGRPHDSHATGRGGPVDELSLAIVGMDFSIDSIFVIDLVATRRRNARATIVFVSLSIDSEKVVGDSFVDFEVSYVIESRTRTPSTRRAVARCTRRAESYGAVQLHPLRHGR